MIVAIASRSLTDTESRYSNIERECLAVMFGLGKFEYYLLGKQTLAETDHSSLEQIFKKNIAEAPARLQRLLLRCMKFDIEGRYRRGETIPVADALLGNLSTRRFSGDGDVYKRASLGKRAPSFPPKSKLKQGSIFATATHSKPASKA